MCFSVDLHHRSFSLRNSINYPRMNFTNENNEWKQFHKWKKQFEHVKVPMNVTILKDVKLVSAFDPERRWAGIIGWSNPQVQPWILRYGLIQPGIEPATYQSQGRHSTTRPLSCLCVSVVHCILVIHIVCQYLVHSPQSQQWWEWSPQSTATPKMTTLPFSGRRVQARRGRPGSPAGWTERQKSLGRWSASPCVSERKMREQWYHEMGSHHLYKSRLTFV